MNDIIYLVGICIIAAPIFIYIFYREHKLRSSGKIMKRKIKFVEESEEFTLSLNNPSIVAEKIQNLPYREMKVSVNTTGNQKFRFSSGYGWDAGLFLEERNGDKSIYCFGFLNWRTKNNIPIDNLHMNMLLTAIEKMFLDIDPQTKVQTKKVKAKRG